MRKTDNVYCKEGYLVSNPPWYKILFFLMCGMWDERVLKVIYHSYQYMTIRGILPFVAEAHKEIATIWYEKYDIR